jgi:hypothetical protein
MDPAIQVALRLSLALLLLGAFRHKARDLGGFRAAVADYRILPVWAVTAGTALLLAGELSVGIALLVPGLGGVAAPAAAALLTLYSVAIGVNLVRGRRDIDCGCSGPGARRTLGEGLLVRNAVLIATATLCALPTSARPLLWLDALTALGGGAALTLLYAAVDAALANAPWLQELRGGTWSMR